jgi:hypothetical protein
MRHIDEPRSQADSRSRAPAGVWSLAALSVAVCLISVLGAKLLSNMLEDSDAQPPAVLGRDAGEAEMRRLARSAPQAEAPRAPTILNGAGVDGTTTGTIPRRPPSEQALSPCGDPPK